MYKIETRPDGRILLVTYTQQPGENTVDRLPDGPLRNYRFANGQFELDPQPEPQPQPGPSMTKRLEAAEAAILELASLTAQEAKT